VGFVRSPRALLSGGRVVQYCVSRVVWVRCCAGRIVAVALVFSLWWYGCRCGGRVVAVVVRLFRRVFGLGIGVVSSLRVIAAD
jgi:hypothetical protein